MSKNLTSHSLAISYCGSAVMELSRLITGHNPKEGYIRGHLANAKVELRRAIECIESIEAGLS